MNGAVTMPIDVLAAAAWVLCDAGYPEAERNEYGSTTVPGWRLDQSDEDEVRVEHALPRDIVGAPDRMGPDDRYFARLENRDRYAEAFTAAGWAVRTKTVLGNRSILFATMPPPGSAARASAVTNAPRMFRAGQPEGLAS